MRQHWNWKALIIGQKKMFKRKVGVKFKTPALARKIQLEKLRGVIWSLLRTRNLGYKCGLFYNDCYLEHLFYQTQTFNRKCLVWKFKPTPLIDLIRSQQTRELAANCQLPTAQIETFHPIPAAQSPYFDTMWWFILDCKGENWNNDKTHRFLEYR